MRSLDRSDYVWLLAIVLLAFALRLIWVLYATADPIDGRFDDSVFYHVVAAHMAEGGGYTNPYSFLPTAEWAPGYIFLLTPLYWLFGSHHQVAEVANVVLGAATVAALYLLARELFNGVTARIAAVLLALFPGQVLFTSVIYSETLFTFVFVLALLLLSLTARRGKTLDWRWVAAFGLVAGAAALVRGVGLWLLIIAPLYWAFSLREWRPMLRGGALAFGAAALVILPWTVRNIITLDSPVLISTSAGLNFWQGHHEGASGGNEPPIDIMNRYGPLTRPGAEVDISNAGLREGLRFALTHPREELSLSARKVRELYKHDTIALDLNENFGERPFIPAALESALRITADSFYFFVLALGVLALVRTGPNRRALLLPVLVAVIWTLGHIALFGQPRYHMPLMPVFCILAAWTLAGAFGFISRAASGGLLRPGLLKRLNRQPSPTG